MDLIKDCWTKNDFNEFNNYLLSLANMEKAIWTKRIYATQKQTLAIKIPILRELAKKIAKGNLQAFLMLQPQEYIENDILSALIINFIKDFDLQKVLINNLLINVDSWVCTDTIKPFVKRTDFNTVYNFSCVLIKSEKVFVRRFAFVLLLKFAKYEECTDKILMLIDNCHNENEYYVKMAISWLICELIIYFPEKTIKFLNNYKNFNKNENNIFILRKVVSKCNDSFRIKNELKMSLKSLIKNI